MRCKQKRDYECDHTPSIVLSHICVQAYDIESSKPIYVNLKDVDVLKIAYSQTLIRGRVTKSLPVFSTEPVLCKTAIDREDIR